jgi:two-component system, sensor histidine kinase PdtaS
MTADTDIDCRDVPAIQNGDLVSENQRLRGLLERSTLVAASYATMLREGDHRIKNSLQIVASLVRLQAGHETSIEARTALNAAAMRIQAVGGIHDALQQGAGQDVVDIGEALRKMCLALNAMAGDPLVVEVVVDVQSVFAPVAMAQPIALAVNELVINALRHAFPDDRRGSVRVSLRRSGGQLRIVVADDGVGIPAEQANKGYGMRLVRMTTEQIGGVLYVDTGAGTRVTIVAPEPTLSDLNPSSHAPLAATNGSAEAHKVPPGPPLTRKPWSHKGRG